MRMPVETIVEHNPDNTVAMNHMQSFSLAWTDNVTPFHPVTDGVSQVWYPTTKLFNAGQTSPLLPEPGANWTVLLRGTKTTQTVAVNLSDPHAQGPAPKCITATPGCAGRVPGVFAPALFAVRDFSGGRVAVLNQWREYTTGSGSSWHFDSQVLSSGAKGQPSDLGRMLRNCLGWLAAPSLSGTTLGGYVTPPNRLVSPNESPATIAKFADTTYDYQPDRLDGVDPADRTKTVYRGIIGAYSSISEGSGSVAEFAAAATASKLDFVVFLEPFAHAGGKKLRAVDLSQLKADCKAHSTAKLALIPGYWIENQFGSRLMIFGDSVELPPDVLITADGKHFKIDLVDPKDTANVTGVLVPQAMSWILSADTTGQSPGQPGWNVGYYWLGPTRKNAQLKMTDLRIYSIAAARYYGRDGKLVEDLTEDFKETAESTIVPTPVCVSEVGSPAALTAAVAARQSLTHIRAASVATIYNEGLRWTTQYDSLPTFVSSGPIIDSWPTMARHYVLGEARFVVGLSLMEANISVSAAPGGPDLKEVSIFNGRELFRRFEVNGPHLFRTLLLDADLHKTLVLVATDVDGNVAVANAARSWKAGSNAVIFCGDHTNDCGPGNLLAHGPMYCEVAMVPSLAEPGATWDGGPPASLPLLQFRESRPLLTTAGGGGLDCFLRNGISSGRNEVCGGQDSSRCMQTPHLEYSDEAVQAVYSLQDRIFGPSVDHVYNPWVSVVHTLGISHLRSPVPSLTLVSWLSQNTWGPIAGPTPLMTSIQRFRKYDAAATGIPVSKYAGEGVLKGHITTLFRSEMTFKTDLVVDELIAISQAAPASSQNFSLAYASEAGATPVTIEMDCAPGLGVPVPSVNASATGNLTFPIATGGWFAAWSPNTTAQASIFWNRGVPVVIDLLAPRSGGNMVHVKVANLSTVTAGQEVVVELAQLGTSLTTDVCSLADVLRIVEWIDSPDGLQVLRGKRQVGPMFAGLLEFVPDQSYVAEIIVGEDSDLNMMNAARVSGFQRRWTVGLWQDAGYPGAGNHYGGEDYRGHCEWTVGCQKYTVLGLDMLNATAAPLYTGLAQKTHVRIGHPVIAEGKGAEDVFVQVTHLRVLNGTALFSVAVNNPTGVELTLDFSSSFAEVGMPNQTATLQPGQHLVLKLDDEEGGRAA